MNTILQALEQWGYIGVAAAIFLECFGVPLPGETVLIFAGIAASQGRLNIWIVGILAFVAAVLGDNVGFLIGHYGGRPLIARWGSRIRIGKHSLLPPARVARAERTFKKHGAWIITIARFIDILRQLNGIIAGCLRTHWLRFITYNMIGAALWVGLWSSVSYLAGARLGDRPGEIARVLLYVLAGSVGLAVSIYLVQRLLRHLRPEEPPEEDEWSALINGEAGSKAESRRNKSD